MDEGSSVLSSLLGIIRKAVISRSSQEVLEQASASDSSREQSQVLFGDL